MIILKDLDFDPSDIHCQNKLQKLCNLKTVKTDGCTSGFDFSSEVVFVLIHCFYGTF